MAILFSVETDYIKECDFNNYFLMFRWSKELAGQFAPNTRQRFAYLDKVETLNLMVRNWVQFPFMK